MTGIEPTIIDPQVADGFVFGSCDQVVALNETLIEISRSNIPVLILGESGVGKDVYSRLLHRLSGLPENSLAKVSCAALEPLELLRKVHPNTLSEKEAGLAGSIFIDGIDELDLANQRALLSLLPDSEGRTESGSRARLISTSTRDLEELVESGRFRKDLYFRINGVSLRLLPLRDRIEDLPQLLEYFLQKYAQRSKKSVPTVDSTTLNTLMDYHWSGNIRELENFARRMVALGRAELSPNDLPSRASRHSTLPATDLVPSLKTAARAASRHRERELILEALERTKWNRKRAALELQISYKALLYKLKQIGTSEAVAQKAGGER